MSSSFDRQMGVIFTSPKRLLRLDRYIRLLRWGMLRGWESTNWMGGIMESCGVQNNVYWWMLIIVPHKQYKFTPRCILTRYVQLSSIIAQHTLRPTQHVGLVFYNPYTDCSDKIPTILQVANVHIFFVAFAFPNFQKVNHLIDFSRNIMLHRRPSRY